MDETTRALRKLADDFDPEKPGAYSDRPTAEMLRKAAGEREQQEKALERFPDAASVVETAQNLPDPKAYAEALRSIAGTPARSVMPDRVLLRTSADLLETLRAEAWDALHSLSHAIRRASEPDPDEATEVHVDQHGKVRATPDGWRYEAAPLWQRLRSAATDLERSTVGLPALARNCAQHAVGLMGEAVGVLLAAEEAAKDAPEPDPDTLRRRVEALERKGRP